MGIPGLLGSFAGSFLGSVGDRLSRDEPVWGAHRSHCDMCGHTLSWRDLVPLASWTLSGGRCGYCGASLSLRYPLYELSTALAFIAIWVGGPLLGNLVCARPPASVGENLLLSLFWSIGLVLFITDFFENRLTKLPLGLLAGGGVLYALAVGNVTPHFLAAIAGLVAMASLRAIFGTAALGEGDVWLVGILGLWVGWTLPIAVGLGAGLTIVVELLARRRRGTPRTFLPLGSWLLLGGFLVLLSQLPLIFR